ncbi:TonB-dependent receptor [Candidatus Falkowbacteria bacterium]|nr:TonB-dependent receptor [Candidatus Falkowbacteria bacterium]
MMHTTRLPLMLGASLIALGALPALAEEIIALDEITVSANLEETGIDKSGSSVVVITEDDLQKTADTRVTDYLARLPGVSLRGNGPIGTTTAIVLRGAPVQYVPVLVDGIDVTDPAGGKTDFDFATLTTGDISRIEVLKGSQSALYGSHAVGGVINITTKRASAIGTEQQAAVEYGSYATKTGSYSWATKSDRAELAFTLSHMSTEGFSAKDENDGNFEADGFRANRLSFFGQYELDTGALIGLNGFIEDSRGHFDDFAGDTPASAGNDFTDRRNIGLRAFTQFSTGAVDHKLDLTHFRSNRVSTSDTSWPAGATYFNGTRDKLAYQGATDLGAQARLVFGADTEREKVKGGGAAWMTGAFAELGWAPSDRIDVTATVRQDHHSRFGDFTSGRLAAVYRAREDLLFRAALGNGFRAPSLYELYGPYGDPSLQPEESLSAEIGVEKRWGDLATLRATAFYLEAEDLIGFNGTSTICGQPFGCYAQVPGQSRRSGLELEGTYTLSDRVELGAAYTYTDSSTSVGWAGVARHDVTLFATAALTDALSGTVSVQNVADRPDGLADYTLANATLSYDFGTGHEAYLRVENLFDEEYQTVKGYGTSDRALYVGLRASF